MATVASDILPPIPKMMPDLVTNHIISGYTAKVPGTEEGVKVTVLTDTLSANPFVNAVQEPRDPPKKLPSEGEYLYIIMY